MGVGSWLSNELEIVVVVLKSKVHPSRPTFIDTCGNDRHMLCNNNEPLIYDLFPLFLCLKGPKITPQRPVKMVNDTLKPQRMDCSLVTDSDVQYELQIIKSPDDITTWLRYYWHKETELDQLFVLRRACYRLKRSYKLWVMYLDLRVDVCKRLNSVEHKQEYIKVNDEFEKALELLQKMPLLWVKYLEFLLLQPDVTLIRRKFNEALRTLPLTQHHWIWPLFIQFADEVGGVTGALIYKRYLTFAPEKLEDVLEKLVEFNDIDGSLELFTKIINDESFVSQHGKSPLDLWLECLELLSNVKNPTHKHDTRVETFIRDGLQKFPDQQGKLYVRLFTYFLKHKDYTRAITIFDEGIHTVLTIRDFTMIYDAYTELLESLVTRSMTTIEMLESAGRDTSQETSLLDFRLGKFERLMDDRPFLIDDVKIRQSPNVVENWIHKASLYQDLSMILQTYVQAITKIDPRQATSGLATLWTKYSQVYEDNGDLDTARTILDKAVNVSYNDVDELVHVWIHWSELELRQDDLEMAIKVLEIATRSRDKTVEFQDRKRTVQERIHKSIKLWSFYLDLVESSGDVQKTCEVYDTVFELKIATPLTVVNYANFLEDNNRFEDAFKVYERGVNIFKYPVVFELWNIYLTKAMKRHLKLERMRDLFDHALIGCPPDMAKTIYILYSKLEEDSGSVQRCVKLLERSLDVIDDKSKPEVFEILLQKTLTHFGAPSTRSIYTRALETLPPTKSINFVLKFAQTEKQLHEYSRVRAILQHGAMLQSPSKSQQLWDWWSQFEVENGDKDTYKDMLRWKRKANDEFSTEFNTESLGFIKSTDGPKVSSINASEEQPVENPDAIDLDI